jgi:hypothetical protein
VLVGVTIGVITDFPCNFFSGSTVGITSGAKGGFWVGCGELSG